MPLILWLKAGLREIEFKKSLIEEHLKNGIMPDLTGVNLEDAIYLLERYHIKVKFIGSGGVVDQSIKVGEKVRQGSLVKLELA